MTPIILSLIQRANQDGERIRLRLRQLTQKSVAATIISYEEQVRGRLAEIARVNTIDKQQLRYGELHQTLTFFCATKILIFDDNAMEMYQNLWLEHICIGTMDLKIAAIVLANNAVLLTRNRSDFDKVPNLLVEDWSV